MLFGHGSSGDLFINYPDIQSGGTLEEARKNNILFSVESVEKLLPLLTDGKIIITSDHSNLFGEWITPLLLRSVGHPSGFRHTSMVKVPWYTVDEVN